MQRPTTFLYFRSNFHKYIQIPSCGRRPQVTLIFVFSAIDVLILFYSLSLIWLGRRIRKVKTLKLALRDLIQLLQNSPVKWQQLYFIKADTWPSAKQLCRTLNANECFSRATGPGCYHHNVRILDFQQFHMCLEKFPP